MKTAPQFFRHGPGPSVRLFFFVLLSCIVMAEDLRFKYLPGLRQIVAVAIYPLQRLAYVPFDTYDLISEFIANFHLIDENTYLKQQHLADSEQLLKFYALEAENRQLRKLLNAVDQVETKTDARAIMAEILYTPRDPFSHKITLNRGSQHGIQPGQVVIDNRGIVGQITQLYLWTSEVTLITDKDHSVPVQVVRNNLRSITSGTGKNNELELRFLSVNTDIQLKDLLVTSGIGGVYPPGIPVAVVSKIDRDPADTFARIASVPVAGVDRNRQVLILSLMQSASDNQVEASSIVSKKEK